MIPCVQIVRRNDQNLLCYSHVLAYLSTTNPSLFLQQILIWHVILGLKSVFCHFIMDNAQVFLWIPLWHNSMGIVAISSTHNNLIMFLQSSSCLFFHLFCSHCLHLCFQHYTFTTFTEVSVLWQCHIWKMSIPNLAHFLLWYWWKIELLKSLIDLF